MNFRRFSLIMLLVLFSTLFVQAHGYIIRSIPQDRAVLERPPMRLQYWFSESLEARFSSVQLRDSTGMIFATGGVDDQDDSLMSLRVPPDLPDGAYVADLRIAFASDGHVIAESRVFFVGQSATELTGLASAPIAQPFEILWKTLLFNASYLLFGVAVLYAYVLVPVWGNEKYPQGLLPPRLMRRLNLIFGSGLIGAILANSLALIQQTMVFFNVDFAQALNPSLWDVVRIGSRFGDVWNFRMLTLIVAGMVFVASLYYGRSFPKFIRSFWSVNIWVLALLIGGQAVNSHGAGSLVLPWVAISIHWLHTLAVAFWVGGILALVFILPEALAPYSGDARWQALYPMMRRFSRYVVGAVALVITTGFYSASNWFFTPSDLMSGYGASLAYKMVMVALLLVVGALHHIALRPHLIAKLPTLPALTWFKQFSASLRLEALFVILTLLLAGLLSATPIPTPDFLAVDVITPSAQITVDGYRLVTTISPGGTGINSFDIVAEDTQAIAMQIINPSAERRTRWLPVEAVDNGLFVAVSDAINQVGTWQTIFEIEHNDGSMRRIALSWDIRSESTILETIPPSWVSVLALISVLGALGFVLYPTGRQLARRMDWSLVNVVISLGMILITVIAIWGSIVFFEQQSRAVEAQRNPPPQIINVILPDQASLNRGTTLIQSACATWLTVSDYTVLLRQIELMRDDILYTAVTQGWRDLPACVPMDDESVWDVVNALRAQGFRTRTQ